MSQELLYSVIARPTLGAENLVYRRRVAKPSEKDNAKRAESKEQKFTKDQNRFSDDDGELQDKEHLGSNNDSTV